MNPDPLNVFEEEKQMYAERKDQRLRVMFVLGCLLLVVVLLMVVVAVRS
jgi:hypothetical protein